jgi:nucleoside 2-deoxyribosyltransferase
MVLKGKKCYLSGAIEHDNSQVNWRIEPKRILTEEFGIDLYDPFDDPKQTWVEPLNQARENCDYETMTRIAKVFVRSDLAHVDRSDFLIANLLYKVPTTGVHHEVINATNAKKPVLLICEQGKQKIPAWYYGFVPHEVMFGSWDDLYEYLREVNAGKHKHNNRWHFIYGMI